MTEDDIFASMAEIYDERAGICNESGLPMDEAEAIAANEALDYYERHRGQSAADRLRADALAKLREGK